MKKIASFCAMILANIGALLVVPTTFIAFMIGLLSVLHARAFVHGWNKGSGGHDPMSKEEVLDLIRESRAKEEADGSFRV